MNDGKDIIVLREKTDLETQTDYVNYIISDVIPSANAKLSQKIIEIANLKENIATLEKEKADLKTQIVKKENEKYESLVSRSEIDLKALAKDFQKAVDSFNKSVNKDYSIIEEKIDNVVESNEEMKRFFTDKQREDSTLVKKSIKEYSSNMNNAINNAKRDIIENVKSNNEILAPKFDQLQSYIKDSVSVAPNVIPFPTVNAESQIPTVEEKQEVDYQMPEEVQQDMINNDVVNEEVNFDVPQEEVPAFVAPTQEEVQAAPVEEVADTQMPEEVQNELIENANEEAQEEYVNPFDQILNGEDTPNFETTTEVVPETVPTEEVQNTENVEQVFDPFNSILNPEVPEATIPIINNDEVIAPDASLLESIEPSMSTGDQVIEESPAFEESAQQAVASDEVTNEVSENIVNDGAVEGVKAEDVEEVPAFVAPTEEVVQAAPVEEVQEITANEEVEGEQVIAQEETPQEVVSQINDVQNEVPAEEVPNVEQTVEAPVQEEVQAPEQVEESPVEETPAAPVQESTPKATLTSFGVRAARSMLNANTDKSYKDELVGNPTQNINYNEDMFKRYDENLVKEELTQGTMKMAA